MKYTSSYRVLLLLLFSVLFYGCGQQAEVDDPAEKTRVTVNYQITTRNLSDPNADAGEVMLKNILLLFVDTNNKVERRVWIDQAALGSGTDRYEQLVELYSGTKKVYAFSNIHTGIPEMIRILNLREGDACPLLPDADICTLTNNYDVATYGIPMSNFAVIEVSAYLGQTVALELTRMLCKVKLSFKNRTAHAMTLRSFEIRPVTRSGIYIFPFDQSGLRLPAGTQTGPVVIPLKDLTIPAGEDLIDFPAFFLNESVVADGDWLQVYLTTSYSDPGGVEKSEVRRMSLLNIGLLKRNDFLNLPLLLTDYQLSLNLRSYPPIGAYPAAIKKADDEYHTTFSYGGYFSIDPQLKNLYSNALIDNNEIVWSCELSGELEIFRKVPVYSASSRVFEGELKNNISGTVCILLTAMVKDSEDLVRKLQYRMYLTMSEN